MADADTIAYRTWLRDLMSPMVDSAVGVVTGNRWYDPTPRSWGSMMRYIYGACCVVPMFFMRATWGGSLAMRREVFDQPYFLERMRRTSSEESAIQDAARKAGLRLAIQPNVMILNRESCSLQSCFRFVRRQLIWTRLYHPNWNRIVVGTLASYLVLGGGAVVAIMAASLGEYFAASLMGGALLLVLLTAQVIIEWLHTTIAARAERAQGESFPRVTAEARLRLLVALPAALVFFTLTVIIAAFSRRVQWRGITYRIVPPNGIRMVEYRPYAEVETGRAEEVSLS